MALVLADRVQQTGTANTTVSFTLSGAVTGFQSFAVVGNGNTTYYASTDTSGNWEVGIGTYSTTGPTLTRTTVIASSNSGAAVTFSGTVTVFVTQPAENTVVSSNNAGTTGYVLTSNGTGVAPSWQPGGVTNVTGTAPISVATGTTTPAISISQATTSTNGYLSSTDWNTFNNKLSTAVTSAVAGTGISVSGATGAVTFTNSGVTSVTAGTGISVSASTGGVTITNTATSSYVGDRGQVFTSSGTFTIPTGVTALKITVVGGGGNGGGGATGGSGGGGGAGGAAISYLTGLTPGGTLTVTRGGAGGTSSVASGTQAITTISATGGSNGTGVNAGGFGFGGNGGSGSNGTINLSGSDGFPAAIYPCVAPVGGNGGASILGGGGRGGSNYTVGATGAAGKNYGGGGGGGADFGGAYSGGAGAGGVIIFEW